ncbi:cell division cycle-associated protein 7-like [Sitophilus oryzae]|uniref:Cell division cycle-associated protein 7-like n=1 Tax=Sitophilus oryzae TaxID=7048 RepID=A0A6J2Y049_SITOR|nr:cell division cycle-associated protein 7-like [Sitophilus oryzae]
MEVEDIDSPAFSPVGSPIHFKDVSAELTKLRKERNASKPPSLYVSLDKIDLESKKNTKSAESDDEDSSEEKYNAKPIRIKISSLIGTPKNIVRKPLVQKLQIDEINNKKHAIQDAEKGIKEFHQSDSEDFGGNSDNEDSVEEIRRRNIEAMNTLLNSIRDSELEKQFKAQNKMFIAKKELPKEKVKKRRRGGDIAFRFNGFIPFETRKSSRLQNKEPEYKENDLEDVSETLQTTYLKRPNYHISEYTLDDLEEIVARPRRKSIKRKVEERIVIPAEDVTQAMINNIALRVKGKKYSSEGTTCHQCRQKTLDQKTCCRSKECTGIQGMFCGVCIKNRYGEDAAVVLKDPNWICPVCRGICNCSICRTRQGKRPTGVLVPVAQQQGFISVSHFLQNLKGYGDKPEEDYNWEEEDDIEDLLGFSEDGSTMHLKDLKPEIFDCPTCFFGQKTKINKVL